VSALPLRIEAAAEADLGALHALERRCHSHPWNLRHFAAALRDATTRTVVLRDPGREMEAGRGVVGYCIVQVAADEMHIHNLVVEPESRRAGLGRRLLADALAYGAGLGACRVYLEVRQSNWAALELYRAAGFEAVAVRKGYYDRPREDALELRLELRPANP
jgi:ribosomal-protein-alanine N-acetyltransferase